MTNQGTSNEMDLISEKIFTPEQERALEKITKKCLHFMDANVLRKRAIQNIQAKIAAMEMMELNSRNKKKRCQKLVLSFQNSVGCSVRMSDNFSNLSKRPLPIINKKIRKKKKRILNPASLNAKTTVISLQKSRSSLRKSNICNNPDNSAPIVNLDKKEKALKTTSLTCAKATVIPLQNSSCSSIKSNNCNIFPENRSPVDINFNKKKEAMKPVSQILSKTAVMTLQSSSSLLKSNNCNTAPENPPFTINLGEKRKTLESIRPARIKTSVKKYVPENAKILARILEWKRTYRRKKLQKENQNRYQ